MVNIFNTMLYEPLYNILVFLISTLPGESLGFSIIILTIFVKFLLLPLTHKQASSQRKMKTLEPEMKKIKEVHKNNKQEQSKKTMELYQKHGINPFSGCVAIIIQIPVILALYRIFFKGLENGINAELLYSFVSIPVDINVMFLGYFNLLEKSVFIALLAAVTQYFQMKLAMPGSPQNDKEEKKEGELSFQEEFSKNMSTQFKYILPVMIFFFAWSISAAIALYWTTSNLFSIIHELVVKHKAEELITKKENL